MGNHNARAQGSDISSRNVTSLTVSPKTVNDGSNFNIRVEFDDKAGKIHNGDTINVSWPTQGEAKIEGYNRTIDLTVKGQVVGQVVITTTGATITFNEQIEKLSDVSGFAEFTVQARNLTNTMQEDDKTATITAGGRSDTVTIHKGGSGTGSVFYYKTGDMLPEDPNHVRWFLNVNTGKNYSDQNMLIKDQIQGGQTLDVDSFNITIDGAHSHYFDGPNAIKDFEKYIPGSHITVDKANNTIEVLIPQGYVSKNSYSIHYKTTITNTTQATFDNHSQAWFKEYGQPEIKGESFNYSVNNISADAGITGTVKGELKILKKDKDTKTPIENVKFKLVKKDGSVVKDNEKEITLTTNAQGIADVKGLPVGEYIVTEIEAPEPYQFDKDQQYPFELKDTDTVGHFIEIENAKKVEPTKDVTATKVWKDAETQHPTIYFKLYQKGADGSETAVESAEIQSLTSGTTAVTWKNLPERDKNGQAIEYLVHEVDSAGNNSTPAGYTKEEKGLTVTNTKKPVEKTAVTVNKAWHDAGNQDGKRSNHVMVQLYKTVNGHDEKVGAPVRLDESQGWTYTWNDLVKLDDKDQAIDYTVKEESVPEGYQSTVKKEKENTFTITNAYTPEKTKVEGVKVWDDKDNQDGKRPEKVTVNLLANGEKVKSTEVNAQSNWQYAFEDLPKYADGKAITYTVTEDHVDNYSTTIEGTTITNHYTPGETTATVTKHWEDDNDQDGKRPGSIEAELYADGQPTGQKVTLNESNNWTHTWTKLAEKSQGKTVQYTVKELTQVTGYQTTEDQRDIGNLIITNAYTPEKTKIEGVKVWDDKDNQDGKRPEKVTVNLLANGEKVKSTEVNTKTSWKYAFEDLPKYADGKAITYTVTEDHVEDYSTTIEGTTITNHYTPGETTATVTKYWEDDNDQDGKRPGSIEVELYADGQATGQKATLNESNNWTHTWTKLAEKSQGETIHYTVKELTQVAGYQTIEDQRDIGNLIITNAYTPEKTKVEGVKVWDDKDNQDGKRPEKVTVNLLANGEKVKSTEVNAQSNWQYAFEDLPKYADGKAITYTVTEDHVDNYSTTIEGTTITNHYTPGETTATVTKHWEDDNDQDGKRPGSIEAELYADGQPTGQKATLNESNNWTHTWTKLAEKSQGKAVQYTVKELGDLEGYRVSMNIEDYGNMIITNTRTEVPKPDEPKTPDQPKPNKPEFPEPEKPTPNHPAPKQPEKPSMIGFLPETGQMILQSWVTWVFITFLFISGMILIIKRKKR
ncbi:Cna B-type domain-containing protein [Staphylococcus lutrae]|nr:Cna B-type domain-containing protein [Staphylococcus lutrae]